MRTSNEDNIVSFACEDGIQRGVVHAWMLRNKVMHYGWRESLQRSSILCTHI